TGEDVASFADLPAATANTFDGVRVDLLSAAPQNTQFGTDTLTSIEDVTGSHFDDLLMGNGGANSLLGGGGDDDLRAMGGDDTVEGQAGNDKVQGGKDDDTLSGGTGTDWLSYEDVHTSTGKG